MPDNPSGYVPFADRPGAKPKKAPKTFFDNVVDTVATIPRVAGMGIRLGSGALAGEGGPWGGAIAGGGEAIAELLENGLNPTKINPTRVLVEGGIGMVPFGSIVSKGKMVASALKGGVLAGAGVEGRKWSEGEGLTNPLTDWNKMDYANVGLGATMGAFGGRSADEHLSINPDKLDSAGPGGTTPPPAAAPPRPDITKARGLRVFVDQNIPPTIAEHAALDKSLSKVGPRDPLYHTLGTNERDINPSKVRLAEAHQEGLDLLDAEDRAKGAVPRAVRDEMVAKKPILDLVEKSQSTPLTPDEQSLVDTELKNYPTGVVAKAIGVDKPSLRNPSVIEQEKAQSAAAALRAKEEVGAAKVQQGQNVEVAKAQQQAADLRAKEEIAAAKAQQKVNDDKAAQDAIDQAREAAEAAGMTAETSAPSSKTSVKNGNTTDTITTNYRNPPEPDTEGAATDLGDTPPPNIAPPGRRTIYGTKKEALLEAKGSGAIDVVKDPVTKKGWVHVFPAEGAPAPTPVIPPDVPAVTPEALPVPEAAPAVEAAPVAEKPVIAGNPDPSLNLPGDTFEQSINHRYGEDDVLPNNSNLGKTPEMPPLDLPPAEPVPVPKPKAPKKPKKGGATTAIAPQPAPEALEAPPVPAEPLPDLGPKNLFRMAPSESEDLPDALGVTATKDPHTPTKKEAKAGMKPTAVNEDGSPVQFINPLRTTEQVYEPGATALPEGVVLSRNEDGSWNRPKFGAEAPPAEALAEPVVEPPAPTKPKAKGLRIAAPKVESTPVVEPPVIEPPPTAPVPKKGGKAAKPEPTEEELASMSENERRAYFKKTAPVEDAKFMSRTGNKLSPALAAKWEQLVADAPRLPRGEVMRRLKSLQQEWRGESNAADAASGEPAIGSPRWNEQQPPREAPAAAPDVPKVDDPNGEAGFIDPEFAFALASHAVPALVGAGVGGHMDKEHPVRGALIGGAMGLAAPHALNALGKMKIPENLGDDVNDRLRTFGKMLPNIQRANLLTDIKSLLINTILAPAGSSLMGSLEHGLTGALERDPEKMSEAGNALKNIPRNFTSKDKWVSAWDEAARSIGKNERGELMVGEANTPLQRGLATPGTAMTAGDMIGRDTLTNAGISEPAARRMTVTSEPRSATAEKFVNFARTGSSDPNKANQGNAILAKLMLPFSRTTANVIEGSLERTPILGFFVQWTHDPALRDSLAAQVAQQGIGAGVAMSAYQMGKKVDPDMAKQYKVQKAISNMSGQYGSLAAIAFAAGQAEQQGKDPEGTVISTAAQDVPLPTVQSPVDTVKSVWNLIHGEKAHPNAEHLPQQWLPNMLVPGFLRDTGIDDIEQETAPLYKPFSQR